MADSLAKAAVAEMLHSALLLFYKELSSLKNKELNNVKILPPPFILGTLGKVLVVLFTSRALINSILPSLTSLVATP